MPGVNVYYSNAVDREGLMALAPALRAFIADRLSNSSRKLAPGEVSLRLHLCTDAGMIAPLELEIHAHHYPERVAAQDSICRDIARFMEESQMRPGCVHVWLSLSELGHSWRE